MRIPFTNSEPAKTLRQPQPSCIPILPAVEISARYRGARIGGDFFDFLTVPGDKLLFILMDIAGRRENALNIAAVVQSCLREYSAHHFPNASVEDSLALTGLVLEINREIMAASGGVCNAPAFLGCYDQGLTTLTYINAGHTPGILKDAQGTLLLAANGLPLGLFSHATHDTQYCALAPGAILALVSRGIVEDHGEGQEFGIEGVERLLAEREFTTAEGVCNAILGAVSHFERKPNIFSPALQLAGLGPHEPNDLTALAMLRKRP
ncbi:MAG: serine/threonine-protein phosphatase [Acidobacteriales bacterium]|nr:serine/threonine-protein phosphatase [Terriglobales bacterium]